MSPQESQPSELNYIILMFPNDTKMEIKGDIEVIKQLVNHLDGLTINYGATDNTDSPSDHANTSPVVRKPKEGGVKANELDEIINKFVPATSMMYADSKTNRQIAKAKLETLIATRTVEAKLKQAEDDWWAITHATLPEVRALLRPRIKELKAELAASLEQQEEGKV